jgi:actin-like ATPase involved in cell morphogenesis
LAFDIRVIKISEVDGGGELRFLEQVRHLPDDYVVIIGAVVGTGPSEQSQEYDAIVIGPPGIFILEVKNWAGQWSGTPTRWYRGLESKPSPIATARKKWEFLKDWLRNHHGFFTTSNISLNYWIDYGVVLTHPTTDVSGVQDPAKDKYILKLDDVAVPQLDRIFRLNSAKRIEDYYEARQIADKLAPQSAKELLAIDFGTTYSSVAMYTPEGAPHVFKDGFNNSLVPSVFGFQDKKEFVGRRALYALGSNRLRYSNYVPSAKTYLGLTEAQYAKLPPRQRPPGATFDHDGLVVRLDKRRFTINEVAARLFSHLRDIANQSTARTWLQAVVSVPARFTHEQRSAVYQAARMAGFETISLIDEPTAAALAFGVTHKYTGCVAVYDLGGGTFDFSILQIANGGCNERAKVGKLIGGDDFDYRLYTDSKRYFAHTSGSPDVMDQLKDREQYLLLDACEKAKIALSGDEEATILLDNWRGATSLNRTFQRPDFEILIEDLVRETIETCKEGLAEAGDIQITDVLLVGGSTCIPLVRKRVAEFFGRPVRSDIDANSAVVYGAAIKAGMLMGRVKGAFMMSRVSQVTIGIPTSYALASWSNHDNTLTIEPIRERCSDTALLKLRESMLFYAGRGSCTLEEVRALVRQSGADVQEYSDASRTVFFTAYSILHPIIGRSELIETDGQIVEFSRSFFTAVDGQQDIDLTSGKFGLQTALAEGR